MKKRILQVLRIVFFAGFGFGVLLLLYRSQNRAFQEECALKGIPEAECSLWDKVIGDFASADYSWIALVLLMFAISNLSRSIRWRMLIRPLGYNPRLINCFGTIIIGYFANLGIPRIGEVVRGGTLAQYERISMEKVMGTIVVDRVIDVISILLITALAVLLQFQVILQFIEEQVALTEKFGGIGNILLLLSALGLALLGVAWLFRARIKELGIYRRVRGIVIGFAQGLRTIRQLDRPWLFIFHSVNIWLMYYLMNYVLFFSFAPTASLDPIVGLVVFVFGGWGIVVPSPGGMGTYHFMVQTALAMYGISGDDGFSFANIAFFSIQLGGNVLLGLIALLLLPILNRHYHPRRSLSTA